MGGEVLGQRPRCEAQGNPPYVRGVSSGPVCGNFVNMGRIGMFSAWAITKKSRLREVNSTMWAQRSCSLGG